MGEQKRERQVSFPEALLPFLTVFRRHLGGMLARFEGALEVREAPVAFHEVAVHLGRKLAVFQQAGAVDRAVLAVAGQPSQRIRVELVARVVAVAVAASNLPRRCRIA